MHAHVMLYRVVHVNAIFVTDVMRVKLYQQLNGHENIVFHDSLSLKALLLINRVCNVCNAWSPVTRVFWSEIYPVCILLY